MPVNHPVNASRAASIISQIAPIQPLKANRHGLYARTCTLRHHLQTGQSSVSSECGSMRISHHLCRPTFQQNVSRRQPRISRHLRRCLPALDSPSTSSSIHTPSGNRSHLESTALSTTVRGVFARVEHEFKVTFSDVMRTNGMVLYDDGLGSVVWIHEYVF